MRRVEVALAANPYPVLIGSGALVELGGFLSGTAVVIADRAVPRREPLENLPPGRVGQSAEQLCLDSHDLP